MLVQFYGAFAPISFTILGLWFIVVQTRHQDWARSNHHRRTASAVARLLSAGRAVSIVLFILIAAVACAPGTLGHLGINVVPLQAEATLLSLLVFVGLVVAWLLLFTDVHPRPEGVPPG